MCRRIVLGLSFTITVFGAACWANAYSTKCTVNHWTSPRHHVELVNACGVTWVAYYLDYPLGLPDGFSKRIEDSKVYCPQGVSEAWYVAVLPWFFRPTPSSLCIAAVIRPWLFVVLGLIYPLYVFFVLPFIIRRRRALKGLCIHCAYDLTGNTSGLCPECGKPIITPSAGPEP